MKRRTQEIPMRSSRLRFSELPPADNDDKKSRIIDNDIENQPADSPNGETATSTTASAVKGITLEIYPSTRHPSGADTLPALLGLNTLSLSLPSSTAAAADPGSTTKTRTKPPRPISKLVVCNVPAGQVHLLFASSRLDTGVRNGFWFDVPHASALSDEDGRATDRLVSVAWHAGDEELVLLDRASLGEVLETMEMDDNVKTFDYAHLIALQAGARTKAETEPDLKSHARSPSAVEGSEDTEWSSLARYITSVELDRILPLPTSLATSIPSQDPSIRTWRVSTLSTTSSQALTDHDQDNIHAGDSEPLLHITPISFTRTFPPSAVGAERTRWARDRSWYLSSLVDTPDQQQTQKEIQTTLSPYGQKLLSEAALSFLLAHILGNYPSIQHWKSILALGLTCKSAISSLTKSEFFVELLRLLGNQIRYLTTDPSNGSSLASELETEERTGKPTNSTASELSVIPPTNTADPGTARSTSLNPETSTNNATAAAEAGIFDINGEDGEELARLLRTFARNVDELSVEIAQSESGDSSADSTEAIRNIQRALSALSQTISTAGLSWDIPTMAQPSTRAANTGGDATAISGAAKAGHGIADGGVTSAPTHGVGRRLLRIREGFGDIDEYDDLPDGALGEDDDEDEDERGEFAPVVVDLAGEFEVVDDEGSDESSNDEQQEEGEDEDEEEGDEEMDLRY